MNTFIVWNAQYLFLISLGVAGIFFLKLSSLQRKKFIIWSFIYPPLTYLIAKIAGYCYYNPRPFVQEKIVPLMKHVANNGFPSDHTLLATTIAMLVYIFDKKLGIFLLVVSFLVGASREVSGVHHWLDINGSIIIALVIFWLTKKYILPKIFKNQEIKKWLGKTR